VKAADISVKTRQFPKDKINELTRNSNNKNIRELDRGIYGFKWGYQPRSMRMVICQQIPII
jgi:hypothetical protein